MSSERLKRSRREFLAIALAGGGTAAWQAAFSNSDNRSAPAPKSLRILILGGTGFIGPNFVRAVLDRGHSVAVFNRGKETTQLPETVERLIGDRNGDLQSIRARDWDAVVDLATYGPVWVKTLGEALKSRVGHYTFISTESVYDNTAIAGAITEGSKVLAYQGSEDAYTVVAPGEQYGALKVLCEREAERQFPGRALILRPGYIVGPGDPQGYLAYWLARMDKGGEVLATGDPSKHVQFIDVRDLAEWAVRMLEKRATGIYNTVGPAAPTSLQQLVSAARGTVSSSSTVSWTEPTWLAAQPNSNLWSYLQFWAHETETGMRLSTERARAQGLTIRPLDRTLADTWRWYQASPSQSPCALIIGWKKKQDGHGYEPESMPWPTYLERERDILNAWHRERKGIRAQPHS